MIGALFEPPINISFLGLVVGSVISTIVMLALFVHAEKTKNAGIVDVGWSFLMGLLALIYAYISVAPGVMDWVIGGLAAFWAFRLAFHIWVRGRGKEEDGRYQAMRRASGKNATLVFFVFFLFQAFLAVLFAMPFHFAILNERAGIEGIRFWDVLGIAIWVIAVLGELIADGQLERFRKNPANKGKTCRAGLWRYSRHPNYFFEWLHWFAYVAFAVGSPYWALTFMGPILMYVFLVYVSGIPWTEQQSLRSRGDDYRRYQQETSAFFPWFPKNLNS
ncbi:MAG: DUF1295 domain-containing protein [Candidatus Sumerlaeia bacterium]|nr:DUF1295 domain-containing protein [Candidatus Sumerlaeia bacterium]